MEAKPGSVGETLLEEGPFVDFQKKPFTCHSESRQMIPGLMDGEMKASTSRCVIQ